MLIEPKIDGDGSYGFRFQQNSPASVAALHVIGCESRTSPTYYWDGNVRGDINTYIFQYTLSGKGMLEIDGVPNILTTGDAFLVQVPGNHRYYLPSESEKWQFIYITLRGEEAAKCWSYIHNQYGAIVHLPPDSSLIQLLFNIYLDTVDHKINDPFIGSSKAYEFIMECYRYFKNIAAVQKELPEKLTNAIFFIHNNYHQAITLDDMAEKANLSRYYFIKKFNEHMNISPLQYLTKLRIEKAFKLLRETNLTINDIALMVGYANANYFNKVFRKIVGTSAGEFRQQKAAVPFSHLIID